MINDDSKQSSDTIGSENISGNTPRLYQDFRRNRGLYFVKSNALWLWQQQQHHGCRVSYRHHCFHNATEDGQAEPEFFGHDCAQDLKNIPAYDQYGYGVWTEGAPLAADKRDDIMASGYTYPSAAHKAKLLTFFAMTDIHITDKESPSNLLYMQPANLHGIEAVTSVYMPTMLYARCLTPPFRR